MYYDILMVPYEYDNIQKCFEEGLLEQAVEHLRLMKLHYENADNILVIPDPNAPVTLTECSETKKYPSINQMLDEAEEMIRNLQKKNKK